MPLCWEGDTLAVDHRCVDGAGIRAAIILPDGASPEGFGVEDSESVTGEAHDSTIAFKGGALCRFRDAGAQIQFHLTRGAHLYAFGVL